MIDHKAVAKDLVAACNKNKLTSDEAIKCMIYTTAKLIKQQFQCSECSDVESAELLSGAALRYRDEIKRVERMLKNKG